MNYLWIWRQPLPCKTYCTDTILDTATYVVDILWGIQQRWCITSNPCIHDESTSIIVHPTQDGICLGLNTKAHLKVYRSGSKSTNILNFNTRQSLTIYFMLQFNEKCQILSLLKIRKYNARHTGHHTLICPIQPTVKSNCPCSHMPIILHD